MASLLADVDLQMRDGSRARGRDVLQGKVVALYFSAHWCPPCRQFTPVLKDFYEELDGEDFEIVFVSFDHSEKDLQQYLEEAHGDWYHVPFGQSVIQDLAKKYDVSGIPALVVIKPNGDIITKNGRSDVTTKSPPQALAAWKSA